MKINWTWDQYKAAGKHLASYVAGGITIAVAFHFLTPTQATGIEENLNTVYHGLEQVFKGLAGLIAILTPIYTAWKSANNASDASRAKAVGALPGVTVIAPPALVAEAAAPAQDVKSSAEVKIVPK